MFLGFAGSDCSYAVGAALIVAEDSRFITTLSAWRVPFPEGHFVMAPFAVSYLAILASEHEVGLASAAAHLVLLLGSCQRGAIHRGVLEATRRTKRLTPTQFT